MGTLNWLWLFMCASAFASGLCSLAGSRRVVGEGFTRSTADVVLGVVMMACALLLLAMWAQVGGFRV